ncbi:MAG: hypothetical protein EXS36_15715 [Pedosphaera sp.]|nr:hypothetical protein [Pedosphaera sp.]
MSAPRTFSKDTMAEGGRSVRAPSKSDVFQKWTGKWNEYWFARDSGHAFALFRILLGIYLLGYFLRYAGTVTLEFSNQGIYNPFRIPDIALPPVGAGFLFWFFIALIATFTVGFMTRIVTPVILVLFLYYYFLSIGVRDCAYDRLTILFLGTSCITDLDRVWSVTALTRPPGAQNVRVWRWGARLIGLQIQFLYGGAAVYKMVSPAWHEAEMMHYTFCNMWATPPAFWYARLPFPSWVHLATTVAVVVFEFLLPFGFAIRRFRLWTAILATVFHLQITGLLNLPEFLVCVATYPLFFTGTEVRNAAARILEWGRKSPSPRPSR